MGARDRDPRGSEFAKAQAEANDREILRPRELTTEQKQLVIQEGIELEQMTQTPGWKILHDWIVSNLDIRKNFMSVRGPNHQETALGLYALQQKTIGIVSILDEINIRIVKKNRLQEQMAEAERRKNEQEEEKS